MSRDRIVSLLLIALLVAIVLGLDVAVCPVAGVFGFPCPSCGLTRATVALLTGDVGRAWAIHPAAAPVIVYLAIALGGWKQWSKPCAWGRVMTISAGLLLFGMTLLWVARFFGHFGGPVPVRAWRW